MSTPVDLYAPGYVVETSYLDDAKVWTPGVRIYVGSEERARHHARTRPPESNTTYRQVALADMPEHQRNEIIRARKERADGVPDGTYVGQTFTLPPP